MSSDGSGRPRALFVIRHGQTDYNAHDLLLGHRDIPLNDHGRGQAAAFGTALKWLYPRPADLAFICGPLSRTRETMRLLLEAAHLPGDGTRISDDLIELDYGDWEGLTWPQVRERDPHGYDAWHADPVHYPMPGGENYATLTARFERLVATLDRDTVLVTHGGLSRVALSSLGGVDPQIAPKLAIPQDRLLGLRGGSYAWLGADTDLPCAEYPS